MTLLVLLAAVALTGLIYSSFRNSSKRWFAPVAGIAVFVFGMAALHDSRTKSSRAEPESNTTRPLIPTHIDPVTGKPTRIERAEPRTGTPSAPASAATDRDERSLRIRWVALSEDGIRARLKDPDSAIFKDVSYNQFGKGGVVCGQVNSKNGFGGYTGYQRFIAAGDVIGILQEQMQPGEFAKAWNRMCTHPTP